GFGHTIGKPIGYGYVRRAGVDEAFMTSGSYELEVESERVAATLHLGALYDPTGARIKV
ncbi:MAG: glycine cleavage T C-terminal barrel domain-containing protein, partial [Cypionkella sp.]